MYSVDFARILGTFFIDLKKKFFFFSCAVFCMLCHTKHILYNL